MTPEELLFEERCRGRKCRRPGKDVATPTLRVALHKRKMMGKFFRNLEPADTAITRRLAHRDRNKETK